MPCRKMKLKSRRAAMTRQALLQCLQQLAVALTRSHVVEYRPTYSSDLHVYIGDDWKCWTRNKRTKLQAWNCRTWKCKTCTADIVIVVIAVYYRNFIHSMSIHQIFWTSVIYSYGKMCRNYSRQNIKPFIGFCPHWPLQTLFWKCLKNSITTTRMPAFHAYHVYVIFANAFSCPAFSCPAISCPGISSVCFTSCNFTSSIFSAPCIARGDWQTDCIYSIRPDPLLRS